MARKGKAPPEDVVPEDAARHQRSKDLASAEERLRALYERRDECNQLAAAARSIRDTLNTNRSQLAAQVRQLKAQKDGLVLQQREHAQLRDRYQAQARAQIGSRAAERTRLSPSLVGQIESRRVELRQLERQQETTSLSLEVERSLLKRIAGARADVARLEQDLTAQTGIQSQVQQLDVSIDDLFRQADAEHALVQQSSKQIGALIDQMSGLVDDIKALASESDRKHAEALEHRAKADQFHQKASELRSKVLGVREEARQERMEQQQTLAQVRTDVVTALEDPEKIEAAHEAALEALLSGKRLEI